MKSRGRKATIYPKQDIRKIVEKYIEAYKPIGKIKYKEVFLFSKQLYVNRETDYKLSDDYWRKAGRQGREIIDSINDARNAIARVDNNFFEAVSTTNVINEFSNDSPSVKRKIIARLKSNEFGYRNLIEKYNKQSIKDKEQKQEIERLKGLYDEAQKKNKIYEEVLLQWANMSSSSDLKLINTITTGKTRSKTVESLFKDMFSEDPNRTYRDINKESKQDSNIVEFKSMSKNTLVEDLGL